MFRFKVVRITVLSLILGLFSPWNAVVETFMSGAAATAPVMTTQTITVLGYNGTPAANAQIFAWYPTGPDSYESTTIVVTNGSGVGVLSIPQGSSDTATDWTEIQVEPAVGDTLNAFYISPVFDRTTSHSSTINLKRAAFRVSIKDGKGAEAPQFSSFEFPVKTDSQGSVWPADPFQGGSNPNLLSVNKLRDGPFGISLPNTLNSESSTVNARNVIVSAFGPPFQPNQAKRFYPLTSNPSAEAAADITSGNYIFMIFNDGAGPSVHIFDATNGFVEITASGGVFALPLIAANLKIQLVLPDLVTPLTLPDGVTGHIQIWEALDGVIVQNDHSLQDDVALSSSGLANFFNIDTSTAHQFIPVVFLKGSSAFPSFVGEPFWSHTGGFSETQSGAEGSTIHLVQLQSGIKFGARMQTANGTAVPGRWSFNKGSDQGNRYLGSINGTNVANFIYPRTTEEYRYDFTPTDASLGSTSFTVNIGTNPDTLTVTDALGSNLAIVSNGGISTVTIPVRPINFRFFISQPGMLDNPDNQRAGNYSFYSGNDGRNWTYLPTRDSSGEFKAALAPGNYLLDIAPSDANTSVNRRRFNVIVNDAGTVSSVKDSSNVDYLPNSSGTYSGKYVLPFQSSNFYFKIVAPNTSTIVNNSYADYCEYDPLDREQSNCMGTPEISAPIGLSLKSSTTYLLRIHGPNGSNYAVKEFTIAVSSSETFSVTSGAETASQDGSGNYALALAAANLGGVVKDADGVALSWVAGGGKGLSINLEKWTSDAGSGHWEGTGGGAWSEDGKFTLRVSVAGKYRIHAYPQGIGDYTDGVSSDIIVTDANNITITSSSGETKTSIVVKLPTPNFKMIVKNPLTGLGLASGNVQIDVVTGQDRNYYTGVGFNPSSPGLASTKLAEGTYIATVYPWSNSGAFITGLASKSYNITVSAGLSVTVTPSDTTTALTPVSGKFELTAASANLSGHIVDSSGNSVGSSNTSQVNLSLFKLRSDGVNWDWISWANTDRDGFFSMFVDTAGSYRLRIEPYGLSFATTNTPTFTVEGSGVKLNLGDLVLAAPTLRVRVTAPGLAPVAYTGIEIRRNNQHWDSIGTGSDGIASMSFTQAGKYELVVNPSNNAIYASNTRQTYSITVSVTEGVVSVTYNGAVVTTTLDLALGAAMLSGHVYAPSPSTTPIGNTQVVAVNQVTGQEMWENSANTSSGSGVWAMSLPDGRYKLYARAPWGNATYANSALSTQITITNGVASPSSTLNINLQTPLWSGVVKAPGTSSTVIAEASVCLNLTVSGVQTWNCTNTDSNGAWALNPPTGFTAFDSLSSRLEVRENFNPQYSNLVLTNQTTLTSTLPLAGATGLTLRLLNPNTSITVVGLHGESTANLWVNLDAPNIGWLGGAVTNAQGVARFNLANPAQAINARVELNGDSELAGIYAATTLAIAALNARTTIASTLTLTLPNIRGIVTDPATGAVIPNTWVDLMDKTTYQGVGGANTDENGFFALNAPAPLTGTTEYQLTVNPPWNGSSSSTRKTYKFVVQPNGTGVLTDANSGSSVSTQTYASGLAYSMSLASPSITGTVKMPDGTTIVADSWITPTLISTGEVKWEYGSNSRRDGSFGIAIGDGVYTIEANVPWNISGVAKSAPCTVTVSRGIITSTVGCIVSGPSVQLALRSPNLSFTIKDASNAVLPYAHVGIQIGNWHTDAQSDASGNVGIFLSHSDFTAASTGLAAGSSQKVHLVIDPPYGNSDVVRLDCNSGDLGTPCATIPSVTIGSGADPSSLSIIAKLSAPNTRLRVLGPTGTAVGAGAWVSLLAIPKSNPNTRIWVAGSNTDKDGWATFNIDTSTVYDSFTVEVNAPSDQRQTYSTATYGNSGSTLTFATLNNNSTTFRLGTPNLVLRILAPDSSVNKWGWVGVELIDGANSSWVGGYGIDDKGGVALSLSVNTGGTYYQITSNPAPGKSGARTVCKITNTSGTLTRTDLPGCGAITAGAATITLNAGNVTGRVTATAGGTAIAGAIVYANLSDATGDTTSVITATDANGNYGLQLDNSKTWIIKVFPINAVTDVQYRDGLVDAFIPTDSTTKNISLATK